MHHSDLRPNPFNSDSLRWAALRTRNPIAASAFVYCVTSTSICCRPTCKARLARRSNIIFRDTYADATAAGFRACKRCRPELQNEHDQQADVVAIACHAIEDAEAEMASIRLDELAKAAGLTKSHFHRVFKKVMGLTPRAYAETLRAGNISRGFTTVDSVADTPEMDVSGTSTGGSDVAMTPDTSPCLVTGHETTSVNYELDADSTTGVPEMDHHMFKDIIEYTVQPWATGFVLIAVSEEGICWLEAGHSVTELSSSLAGAFPIANLRLSNWTTNADNSTLRNQYHGIFETVMDSLMRPTGKTMNIRSNLS